MSDLIRYIYLQRMVPGVGIKKQSKLLLNTDKNYSMLRILCATENGRNGKVVATVQFSHLSLVRD